jgi:hypothetical protein
MRAGDYAELAGRAFRCSAPHTPDIRLFEDGARPCPPGFERDRWGEWTRLVDRHELSRLTSVQTVAVWQGHRVIVKRVFDVAGDALVQGRGTAPDGTTAWMIDNGVWQARVPIDSLTEVVEESFDFPV